MVISSIGAGGDCSFAIVSHFKSMIEPLDQRKIAPFFEIEKLTPAVIDQVWVQRRFELKISH